MPLSIEGPELQQHVGMRCSNKTGYNMVSVVTVRVFTPQMVKIGSHSVIGWRVT
jgi:hypothetical protein